MSVYLDASILVSLFSVDSLTPQAERFLRTSVGEVIVSDFAVAEFASAIARRVRMGRLDAKDAYGIFADFDTWTTDVASRVETTSGDVAAAGAFVRRLDLPLRTADAINIAIAHRLAATLATFDVKMGQSAKALGMAVAPG